MYASWDMGATDNFLSFQTIFAVLPHYGPHEKT